MPLGPVEAAPVLVVNKKAKGEGRRAKGLKR